MKKSKRIISLVVSMTLFANLLSINANAKNIPCVKKYMSGNDLSYSVKLDKKVYFDDSWANDYWFKPLAYIYEKNNYEKAYTIKGQFTDGFIYDFVTSYVEMDLFGYYAQATVISDGDSESSKVVYNSRSRISSGPLELGNNRAYFMGNVSKTKFY